MKVVILCGGKGTRLREETEFRPKPMVPIGNRPVLWHIMKTYSHFGHTDFVLCLGYKGEMIRQYFRDFLWNTSDVTLNLGSTPSVHFHDFSPEANWRVTLAETGEESGTGFRLHSVRRHLSSDEPFLLTYGDGLATININASIAAHHQSGRVCTVTAVHPAGRFGALRLSADGSIQTFNEKPQFEEAYVNGGYMVCSPRIFDFLSGTPDEMLERGPMERLASEHQLHAFRHEGFWQPMDTYQEAQYLNRLWTEGRAPWKLWT